MGRNCWEKRLHSEPENNLLLKLMPCELTLTTWIKSKGNNPERWMT